MSRSKNFLEGERVEIVSLPLISEQAPISVKDGQSVWDVTQEQMRELRLPTAEEIQSIREMAQREGYQAGEKAGLAAGQKQIQQSVKSLAILMNQLANPLEQKAQEVVGVFAQLLKHLIETILLRELNLDSSQVQELVKQALDAIDAEQGTVTVKLNPADAKHFSTPSDELAVLQENVKIVTDPSVQLGGCFVQTKSGQVDASVKLRLEQVIDQLYENLQVNTPLTE